MLVSPRCPGDKVREVVETTRQKGGWRGQLENVNHQGREVLVDLRTTAIRDRRSRIVGMLAFAQPVSSIPEGLSPKQQEIYRRLGEGSVMKGVAGDMGISVSTVATQIQRILKKLPHLRDAHDLQCHAIRTLGRQTD